MFLGCLVWPVLSPLGVIYIPGIFHDVSFSGPPHKYFLVSLYRRFRRYLFKFHQVGHRGGALSGSSEVVTPPPSGNTSRIHVLLPKHACQGKQSRSIIHLPTGTLQCPKRGSEARMGSKLPVGGRLGVTFPVSEHHQMSLAHRWSLAH